MVKEGQYLRIKVCMKDFGKRIRWMVKEDWYLKMEIIIKGNLRGIWLMGMENKLHPKGTFMKEVGLMINNKERVLRDFLMVQTLREDLMMVWKQDLVNSIS